MKFRSIFMLIAVLASALTSAQACEPRGRKQVRVEGAIEALQQDQVDIRTGRRTETLLITERTRFLQGCTEVDASALRSGDRIVAQVVRLKSGELEALDIRTRDAVDRVPANPSPATGGHKH